VLEAAAAWTQSESVVDSAEQIVQGEDSEPGGGELDCQRYSVESLTDFTTVALLADIT
jgi:hypothetical protein